MSLKALPYFDSPDPKLTFKWRSKCNDNELRLETVVPDDCNTYYTCKIYKDGEYFFSVHHYLEAIGKLRYSKVCIHFTFFFFCV